MVVVNRDVRLAQLAQDVAELRATVDALEDFDQGSDAAATQQKYKAALQERDGLLEDAYRAKQTKHVGTKGTVTFLAVGLTGTGKSELCHWMTGDKKESWSHARHTVLLLESLEMQENRGTGVCRSF